MTKPQRGKVAQRKPASPAAVPLPIEDDTALRAAGSNTAHLASIVESSKDMIISCSLDGIIRSWNLGGQKLLGYSPEEIIGRHASLVVPDAQWADFERSLLTLRTGGTVAPYETLRRRKDGLLVTVELTLSPIMDGSRVVAITATGRDISERKCAEEALRESEERFRAILENSLDAAYRRNLQTNAYDYISPVIERITGYTPEEMHGKPLNTVLSHMHPADIRHVKRAIKKAMATGEPCRRLEYRFQCKDGAYRWMSENFRIVPDASGRPLHLVGIVRDVSDRKRIEEELHESQRLARSTVEAIPAQVVVIDEEGTILDTNKAWRRFARANGAAGEATGRGANYLDVCGKILGLDRPDVARFAAGIRSVSNAGRRMFSMEYACHSPTEKRWFTGYVTPFAGPGDHRMVVAHVNITAVKLAEEAIRANEERLRLFVEHTPAPVVMFDREMRYLLVSRRWAEDFRLPPEDLRGRSHYEVFPEIPERWKEIHRRCLAGATERCERDRFPRADGSVDWVQWEIHPWRDERGGIGGIILFAEIINERVKAEEAIQKLNAELEQRVAARTAALQDANKSLRHAIEDRRRLEEEVIGISEAERARIGQDLHDDLGQQLAGIWCLSVVLENNLRDLSSPETRNAAKIAGLLNNSLALTRSLARGLQPVAADPGGLMAALKDLAERSSELFKIQCRLACRHPVEIHDPATATHLYRIAQEAVTNACKHGHAKRVKMTLSSSQKKLALSISDDGTGPVKTDRNRPGMGMRIMNYRAEALGGSLVFRAKSGGGATVVCTIPPPAESPPREQ